MEKHWDVIYKVPLYLADLVSDWLNGGSMVVQWWSHYIEFNATGHDCTVNWCTHEYFSEVRKLGIPSPDWGVITIAMSWFPAAFSVLWISRCCIPSCSLWYWHLVRFILWPILVPIDM